ncbi:MAG: UDP-N-acetylglucosamine--N-acetylmuramyl-(pentapeptide) pyrophosphoryl-undecaprenol N-acetylglucosamine transferase [Oscillospiraceae bacterium]|nr:UDP-N-acetylglucosamine--N-acetylmuramyl-(pentapeptide) pyrophosphoryl-undecaprenol N-acetylglucosamine transferase [Oscillospiraceae bacterium]
MRVLFTCGGTAGHINPAVALAGMFRERNGAEILFVGADGGMETQLLPREGYEIQTVTITSFYRKLNKKSLKHNLSTLRNLGRSKGQAKRILDEFRPDLVVGTGGYASYPVVREAARRGIPTAVHESNAEPGLTTKMLAKHVDRVMVGFEESRQHYPHPERVEVTGTPVRGEFFSLKRAEARAKLGFTDDKPVVLTSWGSLGALVMNEHMVDFVARECADGVPFHHIYGVGTRYYQRVLDAIAAKGIDLKQYPDIDIREYIYDMPVVMDAADVMLSRAGASTISEITSTARPAVLVPSPNVTANHQEKNARVLSDRGAAVLMLEGEASGDRLYETVRELIAHPTQLEQMRAELRKLAIGDANERIYQVLMDLTKK